MPQSPHLGAVPFFLMWRYRRLPPGVLITRTLLDRVLYLIEESLSASCLEIQSKWSAKTISLPDHLERGIKRTGSVSATE